MRRQCRPLARRRRHRDRHGRGFSVPAARVSLEPDAHAAAGTFSRLMVDWRQWMVVRNYSIHTQTARIQALGLFAAWLSERSVFKAVQVQRAFVEAYQRSLTTHIKKNGQPLAIGGQYQRMRGIAAFFSWAHRKGHIPANPAADLELPRLFKSLPFHLSHADMAALRRVLDGADAVTVRNRAILETLYSTGIRRAECANLRIDDLDPARGVVRITKGKGGKDRVAPIGADALGWIQKYIRDVRSAWCHDSGEFTLFLNESGGTLGADRVATAMKSALKMAKISKPGACHVFRHTFATHLLEAGCEMRFIQAMLGHAGMEMTARYAQVSARQLIAAHRLYHGKPVESDHPDRDAPASLELERGAAGPAQRSAAESPEGR